MYNVFLEVSNHISQFIRTEADQRAIYFKLIYIVVRKCHGVLE